MELGTWCWPSVVLIEKRPLTESERSSMNRAARSVGKVAAIGYGTRRGGRARIPADDKALCSLRMRRPS